MRACLQSKDGSTIPSVHAAAEEMRAVAHGIRDAGGGVMQILLSLKDGKDIGEFRQFREIAAETGIPFSYSCMQTKFEPTSWRTLLDLTAAANEEGVPVTAQTLCRPSGILLGPNISYNPLSRHPSYMRIANLPLKERVAAMRTPEVRQEILADNPDDHGMIYFSFSRDFEHMYELGNPPLHEPLPGTSVAEHAQRLGLSPFEIAYDMMLQDEGRAILSVAATNFENKSLDDVLTMMKHPNAVLALGDGGAHYGVICDAAYPTFMLSYWGRDRLGEKIPLSEIIHMLTKKPAGMMRFSDRGVIAAGYKADINVIDFSRLQLRTHDTIDDLPGGGRRIRQLAEGYMATIVAGKVVRRDGAHTGIFPGKLIRRPQICQALH